LRDTHIEAKDLGCEGMLVPEFLRPFDPPLPAILRHDLDYGLQAAALQ
jgi:hypothetical protein